MVFSDFYGDNLPWKWVKVKFEYTTKKSSNSYFCSAYSTSFLDEDVSFLFSFKDGEKREN